MALNAAGLNVGGAAMATAYKFASLHTADPGAAGDQNVIAGGRFAIALTSASGNISLSAPVDATGLTPSAAVAFIGLWSAATGGTYYGSVPRTTGDAAVNASGEYTIQSVAIPGSPT